eukprot:350593-Chlamydomonas_euryale.AAC.1
MQEHRPELPPDDARCPPELRQLITEAWHKDPAHRPSTGEIVKQLMLITKMLEWQELQQRRGSGGGGDDGAAAHGRGGGPRTALSAAAWQPIREAEAEAPPELALQPAPASLPQHALLGLPTPSLGAGAMQWHAPSAPGAPMSRLSHYGLMAQAASTPDSSSSPGNLRSGSAHGRGTGEPVMCATDDGTVAAAALRPGAAYLAEAPHRVHANSASGWQQRTNPYAAGAGDSMADHTAEYGGPYAPMYPGVPHMQYPGPQYAAAAQPYPSGVQLTPQQYAQLASGHDGRRSTEPREPRIFG